MRHGKSSPSGPATDQSEVAPDLEADMDVVYN